jgi:hypothetical protein
MSAPQKVTIFDKFIFSTLIISDFFSSNFCDDVTLQYLVLINGALAMTCPSCIAQITKQITYIARIHSQFESLGFVGKYDQSPTKLVNS